MDQLGFLESSIRLPDGILENIDFPSLEREFETSLGTRSCVAGTRYWSLLIYLLFASSDRFFNEICGESSPLPTGFSGFLEPSIVFCSISAELLDFARLC